jgi:transcription antitermination factor NusG
MPDRWAVAVTEPLGECKAAFHAERAGFRTYLPKFLSSKSRIVPLFPRYLFVSVDDQWRALLTTIGIQSVVLAAKGPALLSDEVIHSIRVRCNANDIFIPPPRPRKFNRGQLVRVDCGPMIGLTGIVSRMRGRDRVEILLSMLGRRTAVHVYEGDLRAA